LGDVAWAIAYAEQNRLAMLSAVALSFEELFGIATDDDSLIHANHNHVRPEIHFGRDCWVHRKGAQSARAGEPGIIPGSMGTASFHVAGRGCKESLCSSSHGAGRKLSRTDARRTISVRKLDRQMESVWFDHRRVQALRDEAPGAYKDIHAVMRAQKKLTRIVRELRPILNYKGV
jgi:tRNA-splicing ligase RtcB